MSSREPVSAWTHRRLEIKPSDTLICGYIYITGLLLTIMYKSPSSLNLIFTINSQADSLIHLALLMSTLNRAARVILLNSNLYHAILLIKFPPRLPIPLRAKAEAFITANKVLYDLACRQHCWANFLFCPSFTLIQAPWPTYRDLKVPKPYLLKAFLFCLEQFCFVFSREHRI